VLRWRERLDWIIAAYSRIKPSRLERAILAILRMGAYQILFMDRVPASAAVDESVKLAKGMRKKEATAFVNGSYEVLPRGEKRSPIPMPRLTLSNISLPTTPIPPGWRDAGDQLGMEETMALCSANNQFPF